MDVTKQVKAGKILCHYFLGDNAAKIPYLDCLQSNAVCAGKFDR